MSDVGSPAGWQPDPFGRYTNRYWDGSIWTEHVTDAAGSQTTDPPVFGPQPGPAGPHTTTPLPVAGLVVVAVGAVFILLSLLVLDWYTILDRIDFSFSDVRDTITSSSDVSFASDQYLSWGWYIGFAVIVVAAAALFAPALRWVAVGAAGLFVVWHGYVVYDLSGQDVSAKLGAWLGAAGFALCAVGVLLPRPDTGATARTI